MSCRKRAARFSDLNELLSNYDEPDRIGQLCQADRYYLVAIGVKMALASAAHAGLTSNAVQHHVVDRVIRPVYILLQDVITLTNSGSAYFDYGAAWVRTMPELIRLALLLKTAEHKGPQVLFGEPIVKAFAALTATCLAWLTGAFSVRGVMDSLDTVRIAHYIRSSFTLGPAVDAIIPRDVELPSKKNLKKIEDVTESKLLEMDALVDEVENVLRRQTNESDSPPDVKQAIRLAVARKVAQSPPVSVKQMRQLRPSPPPDS